MRRFQSYHLGVEQGSQVLFSDFEHDGEMWTGSGPREFRVAVEFAEAFAVVPMIQIGMTMWDIASGFNQRIDIAAENVATTGFDIVFRTWGDTRVARVRCDWTAMGEASVDDEWVLD